MHREVSGDESRNEGDEREGEDGLRRDSLTISGGMSSGVRTDFELDELVIIIWDLHSTRGCSPRRDL